MGSRRDYSDEVAARVDREVRTLIEHAHGQAAEILRHHRATLDRLAETLIERETVDTPELLEIFGELPVWTGVPPANGEQGSIHGHPAGDVRDPEPAA
jgi:ATP-dependent Zn protease